MDTRTKQPTTEAQSAQQTQDQLVRRRQADRDVEIIKAHMPQTYKAIQEKAAEMPSGTFKLVRDGLMGKPNCFYAIEGGRVMGTAFDLKKVTDEVAGLMVRFGCRHLCMWGVQSRGASSGKD